jgi:hypothetical protein
MTALHNHGPLGRPWLTTPVALADGDHAERRMRRTVRRYPQISATVPALELPRAEIRGRVWAPLTRRVRDRRMRSASW